MKYGSKVDVQASYARHPYPSSEVGEDLIYDLAAAAGLLIQSSILERSRVMDAGCGTGHRLVALASQYPDASFVGVDMTAQSLEIATELAIHHGVTNVTFQQADLADLDYKGAFDFVCCTGVLHHMERPEAGLSSIYRALAPGGVAMVWLYHTIGEFDRLLNWELTQIFLQRLRDSGRSEPEIIRIMGLSLNKAQYGNGTAYKERVEHDQLAIDVDAFINPIVKSYRHLDAKEMFQTVGFEKSFCSGFNKKNESRLLDINSELEGGYWLRPQEVLVQDQISEAFLHLSYDEQVTALEIMWRPTGFTTIGLKSSGSERMLRFQQGRNA